MTSDWIDNWPWSQLGQGKVGKAATDGYSRVGVEDSHLNAMPVSATDEQVNG